MKLIKCDAIVYMVSFEGKRKITHRFSILREQTYEVYANRRNVRLGVRVICKSKQQTRLSNTGVTD